MNEIKYKSLNSDNFTKETIKIILKQWIEKVENKLNAQNISFYSQPRLVSVFYRYIQWSLSLGQDTRNKLSNFTVGFLQNKKISKEVKLLLIDNLKNEMYNKCITFSIIFVF